MAESKDTDSGISTAGLTAAIAVVVAALAAIGLTGDALLRAVRNYPRSIAGCFAVALIGGGLFVASQLLIPKQAAPQRADNEAKQADKKDGGAEVQSGASETPQVGGDKPPPREPGTSPPPKPDTQPAPGTSARKLGAFGLVLVVVATIVAVCVGAYAVRQRELPLVTLQAAPVAGPPSALSGGSHRGSIEVTITARAVGMTTKSDFVVQVLGIYSDPATQSTPSAQPSRSVRSSANGGVVMAKSSPTPGVALPSAEVTMCESNHIWRAETPKDPYDLAKKQVNLDPAKAKLLVWDRVGPKADGTIDATWKIQVPAGRYAYVCAWAPLRGTTAGKTTTTAAYLRLDP
jgi:hypothetical protein